MVRPETAARQAGTDVHQHLWPEELVAQLRRRRTPPMLRDWTLLLDGEPPYQVRAADHDPASRAARDPGLARILVSLSAPLGIEALPPGEAGPLLDAWHAGAERLPAPFMPWASVSARDPDLDSLDKHLASGFAGLQLPATELATPAAVDALAPVLETCERADRPVLIHPGPARRSTSGTALPAWWPAVVDYPAQLQAAWWAWHAAGRATFPGLRVCFVAGAGLAPTHHERFSARGGGRFAVDPHVFVDTSSYGRQGIDALVRALGIDVVVLGSDRPYAAPADLEALDHGAAARHAVCVSNPTRLLEGGSA
ncbi:MAG TPA: amidohydrolase family protein [Jatrophihabitans sp.]|nr:amidohydrolase family protein [Jatrophihabitans sp.]